MTEIRSIGAGTKLCAVVGNPISHSLSPAIHNAAYEASGLDFVYVAFRVEDIGNALAGMRALDNFRGLSVTIPHKIEVMKYVDEISDVDRHIGSINTVINDSGRLTGLGTDGPGAKKAIVDAGVELNGKRVLMLGAGGAARAIAFTLAEEAKLSELVLADIDEALLKGLSSDLEKGTDATIVPERLNAASIEKWMPKADLVINCTPIGMHPFEDESLVPEDLFRPEQVIFDIVYNPLETKLLREAKGRGLKIIQGVEMFVNQAVLQFERFTGTDAPADVMRKVVMEQLEK